MDAIGPLFSMLMMGVVVLLSPVAQVESFPDLCIIYCIMLAVLLTGTVLLFLG